MDDDADEIRSRDDADEIRSRDDADEIRSRGAPEVRDAAVGCDLRFEIRSHLDDQRSGDPISRCEMQPRCDLRSRLDDQGSGVRPTRHAEHLAAL